ncbi:hypothetical protein I4641_06745 [Waterburya agarophytonicola K14]|uniref:DUF5648 domain-containing protein n=1 Tax=Waterburya agarophytonicola KI4 TaxID=2874699 RepID=A0A964BRU1_9CYAN|nr:choice-of-anchor Q domain-containing protein [Waterburya agarophytonicola]MCC0176675.1 hypothetical protein [Waterburya agarophytonicola KI4]
MNEENGININNPGGIIYVNQNATGNNNGTSWDNAYTDLQSAIAASQTEDQIWVAAGTYLPTTDGDRDVSFTIKTGTEVYGGFAGGETELSQRDWINNQVILSGNIGNPGDRSDNSYHVVNISDTSFFTIFDGFTITDGQADVRSRSEGGGIYSDGGTNAELRNLIVANNFALNNGGGASFSSSNVNLSNVAFFNNNANDNGGGFYSANSTGEITNSLFVNNRADYGGAIANNFFNRDTSNLSITNSTFAENQADIASAVGTFNISGGDGIEIDNSIVGQNPVGSGEAIVIEDDLITINQSIVQGGFDGAGQGIIDADPLFVDPENNNYSLQADSPAVDGGNNGAIEGISTDLVGNARIAKDTVDLGAYEFVLTEEDLNNNPDTPPENNPDTPPENNPDPENGDDVLEGDIVYRFFNTDVGVHFYTTSEAERDNVAENLPQYNFEGGSYISAPESDSLTGVAPVYRFFNTNTGVHLYTISEVERDSISANLPNYQLEGVAYYGYTEAQENTTPLYRFYNPIIDAHFYTPSAEERDSVLANLPDYQLESNGGIGFYVEPLVGASNPIVPPPSDPITPPREIPADSSVSAEFGEILNSLIA